MTVSDLKVQVQGTTVKAIILKYDKHLFSIKFLLFWKGQDENCYGKMIVKSTNSSLEKLTGNNIPASLPLKDAITQLKS